LQYVSAESNPLRPVLYATALWDAACSVTALQAIRAALLRMTSGVMAGLLKRAWAAASSRLEAQGFEPGLHRSVLLEPDAVPDVSGAALVLPAGASAEGPTAERLSRLFTLIQGDTLVHSQVRAVLARLQVAAIRVALHEPAMLESADHPVWRLLNRIASAGASYPTPADKRRTALMVFCDALAEEISRSPVGDAMAFRRAIVRLDAFLAEQLQWQLREAEASVTALQRAERRALLEELIGRRLTEQIAPVRASPSIRRFVTGAWARVLAESMVRFGEQAEPTPSYMKTVDELLWSLQTPDHPHSRQRLIALLPGLLKRLRSGIALIALPAAEEQAVLDELMALHAKALRPGQRGVATALPADEIVRRMREEVIPDTPALPAFGDSVIDLASMQTLPAALLATNVGAPAEAAKRVDALTPGERLRLFLRGGWVPLQLLWRSDKGLFFLFAGVQAGATHSITRRALERLDAAGLMKPLEDTPVVQRAFDALANQLSLPA